MLANIIEEITSLFTGFGKVEVGKSKTGRKGCPALYFLYKSVKDLEDITCRFINALEESPVNFEKVRSVYENLISIFLEFGHGLDYCKDQLEIYDQEIETKIKAFIGNKRIRLGVWSKALEISKKSIEVNKEIKKLKIADERRIWWLIQEGENGIEEVDSFSLSDKAKLGSEINEAKINLEKLINLKYSIASFIKANCSYADLFTSNNVV